MPSDSAGRLHVTDLGPVVQSIISLMSSLVVKVLTVLVSTISNSQVFLLKKWVAFANAKAAHIFFSKNSSIYAIFNDQRFNYTLTYDIISFEQLGPDWYNLNSVDLAVHVQIKSNACQNAQIRLEQL